MKPEPGPAQAPGAVSSLPADTLKLQRALTRVAQIAGVFVLAVWVAMVVHRWRMSAAEVLKPAQLTELKNKLRAEPKDERLKQEIRALDLRLRQRFFSHVDLDRGGAWLLLAGVMMLVFAAKRGADWQPAITLPTGHKDPMDGVRREAAQARQAVSVSASLVAIAGLVLILTNHTVLPKRGAELEAYLNAAGGSGNPAAPDWSTPEELQANWPRFRGPDGNGYTTNGDYALKWDPAKGEGVLWKATVPSAGFNSPVVWGNRVFLTGGDGTKREVFCFDGGNGGLLWRQTLAQVPGAPARPPEVPEQTGMAAATAATDGRRVYAIFASGELAAFNLEGKLAWATNLGTMKNAYGHASSLVVWHDRLLAQVDQGEAEAGRSRLYAFEAKSGRPLWAAVRRVPSSWATPMVIEAGGGAQVITLGVPWVIAYSAADGVEVWRAQGLIGEITPSPVFAGGLVCAVSPSDRLLAFRADGQGDVTKTKLAWSTDENPPDITSPATNGELIWTITTPGVVSCFDAKDGKKQWEQDLSSECNSSPVVAGDRLYLFTKKGTGIVFEAGRTFKELARSELNEPVLATPAFAQNHIYVRGTTNLFCLGAATKAPAAQLEVKR